MSLQITWTTFNSIFYSISNFLLLLQLYEHMHIRYWSFSNLLTLAFFFPFFFSPLPQWSMLKPNELTSRSQCLSPPFGKWECPSVCSIPLLGLEQRLFPLVVSIFRPWVQESVCDSGNPLSQESLFNLIIPHLHRFLPSFPTTLVSSLDIFLQHHLQTLIHITYHTKEAYEFRGIVLAQTWTRRLSRFSLLDMD